MKSCLIIALYAIDCDQNAKTEFLCLIQLKSYNIRSQFLKKKKKPTKHSAINQESEEILNCYIKIMNYCFSLSYNSVVKDKLAAIHHSSISCLNKV